MTVEYETGQSKIVAITQLCHKKQMKQPQVSQNTNTIPNNRNTMCILLYMKYKIFRVSTNKQENYK